MTNIYIRVVGFGRYFWQKVIPTYTWTDL